MTIGLMNVITDEDKKRLSQYLRQLADEMESPDTTVRGISVERGIGYMPTEQGLNAHFYTGEKTFTLRWFSRQ